jgi:hypothetical protein
LLLPPILPSTSRGMMLKRAALAAPLVIKERLFNFMVNIVNFSYFGQSYAFSFI